MPHRGKRPAAMDLFGGVGKVEVGGERSCELGRDIEIEVGQGIEDFRWLAGPDPLDQVVQLLPLQAQQGLSEQGGDEPYIAAQLLVRRSQVIWKGIHAEIVSDCASTLSDAAQSVDGVPGTWEEWLHLVDAQGAALLRACAASNIGAKRLTPQTHGLVVGGAVPPLDFTRSSEWSRSRAPLA